MKCQAINCENIVNDRKTEGFFVCGKKVCQKCFAFKSILDILGYIPTKK